MQGHALPEKFEAKKRSVSAFQRGKCSALQRQDKKSASLFSAVHAGTMKEVMNRGKETVKKPKEIGGVEDNG